MLYQHALPEMIGLRLSLEIDIKHSCKHLNMYILVNITHTHVYVYASCLFISVYLDVYLNVDM